MLSRRGIHGRRDHKLAEIPTLINFKVHFCILNIVLHLMFSIFALDFRFRFSHKVMFEGIVTPFYVITTLF